MNYRKFKSKINHLINRLISSINFVSLGEKGHIHKTARLKGCKIYGNVTIDEGSKIQNGVDINTSSEINIGKYTSINGPNTDLYAAINKITIGSFCSIARNVSIQEFNHNSDALSTYLINSNILKGSRIKDLTSKGDIEIGNDVWIGTQCVILSGSKIGDGAIIAAGSLVSGVIEPYAIAGGVPAKIIKYRFEKEIINKVMKLQWWHWPIEKIRKNRYLFTGKITNEKLSSIE